MTRLGAIKVVVCSEEAYLWPGAADRCLESHPPPAVTPAGLRGQVGVVWPRWVRRPPSPTAARSWTLLTMLVRMPALWLYCFTTLNHFRCEELYRLKSWKWIRGYFVVQRLLPSAIGHSTRPPAVTFCRGELSVRRNRREVVSQREQCRHAARLANQD